MSFHIVVLSYNHPHLTERCLYSVLMFVPAQDITLVHNGSTAENYNLLKNKFPLITHHFIAENGGYSGGVNEGLNAAFKKNDWVYLITNDCELKTLSQKLTTAQPCLITPKIFFKNSGRVDSVGALFLPTQGKLSHCKTPSEFQKASPPWITYAPGSAFLIHREVFEITGDFDESLGTFWEDVDFSIRVQRNKFMIHLDVEFLVAHSGGKTTRKNPYYTTYLFQRNRAIISRRYCQTPLACALLWVYLGRDWTRFALRLLRAKEIEKLKWLVKAIKDSFGY